MVLYNPVCYSSLCKKYSICSYDTEIRYPHESLLTARRTYTFTQVQENCFLVFHLKNWGSLIITCRVKYVEVVC
jgi:hypothetical protein